MESEPRVPVPDPPPPPAYHTGPRGLGSRLVSRSQTSPLFDIWAAGRESGALTLKLLFRQSGSW